MLRSVQVFSVCLSLLLVPYGRTKSVRPVNFHQIVHPVCFNVWLVCCFFWFPYGRTIRHVQFPSDCAGRLISIPLQMYYPQGFCVFVFVCLIFFGTYVHFYWDFHQIVPSVTFSRASFLPLVYYLGSVFLSVCCVFRRTDLLDCMRLNWN
jgi:hypothetical protein